MNLFKKIIIIILVLPCMANEEAGIAQVAEWL